MESFCALSALVVVQSGPRAMANHVESTVGKHYQALFLFSDFCVVCSISFARVCPDYDGRIEYFAVVLVFSLEFRVRLCWTAASLENCPVCAQQTGPRYVKVELVGIWDLHGSFCCTIHSVLVLAAVGK